MAEQKKARTLKGVEISAFLARLRRGLEARGMSQAELARALGVGEATVSEWFTRGRVPQGDVFLRLPSVLQVNGHWLLTGDGPEELADPGGDAFRTGVRTILEELREFAREERRRHGIEGDALDT